MSGCPMWDEFNGCCMWERIEKIFQTVWECEDEIVEACFEEMP